MRLKRTAVLLLAALMTLAVSCTALPAASPRAQEDSAANFNPVGYPIADKTITVRALQYEVDNQLIDFAGMWFFEELEKKTNVHVVFEEVKEADWDTKVNLMFASGNYSDLIIHGDLDVEEYGVTQKLVVPLDDYLETYMPNYYSRLGLNGAGEIIPSSDGKSYYVGFLISQDINTDGHWFINRRWLDRLNLAVPKTVDELTRVLRAFKTDDPNGNGAADEIPYQANFNNNNNGVYNMFAAWGIPENIYYVHLGQDGRVRFSPYQEGYRQCLEWLNTLYAQGLIDPECIAQDSNMWGIKTNQGTSGFFTYWRLKNSVLYPDVASQFECILPVAADGFQAAVSSTLELPLFGAAITVSNPYLYETLRWLDAQMETETMMVSQNGRLGETLALGENGKYRVVHVPENNRLYEIVPVICGQFFAPKDYYYEIYEMAPHRLEKAAYCDWYTQSGVMEAYSFQYLVDVAPLTAEESKRISALYTEIDKCVTEAITRFITKGVTDAQWNEFLSNLASIGAQEYILLYQEAYDRYLETKGRP